MNKNNLLNSSSCDVASKKATSICYSKAENFISKLRAEKNNCEDSNSCYITFEGLEAPAANVQDPGPAYDSEEISNNEITVYCYKSDDINNSKFSSNYYDETEGAALLHSSSTGESTVTVAAGKYKSIIYFVNKTEQEKEDIIAAKKEEINSIAKEAAISALICYTGNTEMGLWCKEEDIDTEVPSVKIVADTFKSNIEFVNNEEPTFSRVKELYTSANTSAKEYLLSTLKCSFGNEAQTKYCTGTALSSEGYSNSYTVAKDYLTGLTDFSDIDSAQDIDDIQEDVLEANTAKQNSLNTAAGDLAESHLNCYYGNEAKTYICGSDGFNAGTFPVYYNNKGIAKRNYVDVDANTFIATSLEEANAMAKEFAAASLDNCGYYSNKIELNCDLGTPSDSGSLNAYNTTVDEMNKLVEDPTSDLYTSAVQKVKAIPGLENSAVTFSVTLYTIDNGGGSAISCYIDDISYLNKDDDIKSAVAEILYSSFYPNSAIYINQNMFLNPTFANATYFYDNPNTIFYLYNNNYITVADSTCLSCSITTDTTRIASSKSSIRTSSLKYGDMSSIAIASLDSDEKVNESALNLASSSISCMYGNQALNTLTCVALQAATTICTSGLLYANDTAGENNRNGKSVAAETYISDSPSNADDIAITVQRASMICPCLDWGGGGGTSITVSANSNCTSCGDCAVFKS